MQSGQFQRPIDVSAVERRAPSFRQALQNLPRIGVGYQLNPKTVLRGGYGIYYDTTLVPGVDPTAISISGQYLTDGSVIYFNGEPLTSGTTNIGDSILTGTIPVFSDLYPEIQVYNPPLPGTNGTDGGLSNPGGGKP